MNILGLTKPSAEEILEERDSQMRSQYFDPIENFPDRIDQLLESLNQVCWKEYIIRLYSDSFLCYLDLHESKSRIIKIRKSWSINIISKLKTCILMIFNKIYSINILGILMYIRESINDNRTELFFIVE